MAKALNRPNPGHWAIHLFCLYEVHRYNPAFGSPKGKKNRITVAGPWLGIVVLSTPAFSRPGKTLMDQVSAQTAMGEPARKSRYSGLR